MSEAALELDGVGVRYGGVAAVRGLTLTVRRGEIVGFAGLMGAGRTELARSIFGRSYGRFLSGQINLDGKEVELKSVKQAIDAAAAAGAAAAS